MRRAGGHLDQPGGWSLKTYVRVQKLRASAELCPGTERIHSIQVSEYKRLIGEYFRNNLIREFFRDTSLAFKSANWECFGCKQVPALVLGSLIHEKARFVTISGRSGLRR